MHLSLTEKSIHSWFLSWSPGSAVVWPLLLRLGRWIYLLNNLKDSLTGKRWKKSFFTDKQQGTLSSSFIAVNVSRRGEIPVQMAGNPGSLSWGVNVTFSPPETTASTDPDRQRKNEKAGIAAGPFSPCCCNHYSLGLLVVNNDRSVLLFCWFFS